MGAVLRRPGSIGYGELAYVLPNDIKFGSVQNKEGNFITADLTSVTAAADASLADVPDDLRYSLTNAPGKDSYPIVGTTWAIVHVNNPRGKGAQVRDFLHWATHEGQEHAEKLNHARLPKGLVERVEKKLALIQ